jgi:hypothetical protein
VARETLDGRWDKYLGLAPQARTPSHDTMYEHLTALIEGVRVAETGWLLAGSRSGPTTHGEPMFRTALSRLEADIKKIATATGFSEAGVLGYLLAGIEPILPPATISIEHVLTQLPDDRFMERSQVHIVLHAYDLSYLEHRALYRQLRRPPSRVRARGLTDEDLQLLRVVARCGAPPSGTGAGAYWRRVQREWHKRGRRMRYKSPDGLRIRHGRLLKKLAALDLEQPGDKEPQSPRSKPPRTRGQ